MRYYFHIDTRPTCSSLHDFSHNAGLVSVENIEDADIIVVGGGDGFMLQSMRELYTYGKPFLGLNCGTLGFMLNPIDNLSIENFSNPSFQEITVDAVAVSIVTKDGSVHEDFFFNDCVIGGSVLDYFSFSVIHTEKSLNVLGTGLVINTMLGSTGYALNLGQPIIPVDSDLWGVVGIASAPFHYGFLSPDETLLKRSGKNTLLAGFDGYSSTYENIESIICKKSSIRATLLFFGNNDFATKRLLLAEEKMGR